MEPNAPAPREPQTAPTSEPPVAYVPHSPRRILIGRVLLVAGFAGWIAAGLWLVANKQANFVVMGGALAAWVVFFVGKTLLKAAEPRRVHR